MFQLWKEINVGSDKEKKYIKIVDAEPITKYFEQLGVDVGELNFFEFNALPDRSYGKFLVSENEWNNLAPEIKGDTKINLTINDSVTSVDFIELEIKSMAFIATPITYTASEQDGFRYYVVEVELQRNDLDEDAFNFKLDDWEDVTAFFEDPAELQPPIVYYPFAPSNISKHQAVAHVADLNFLTAYFEPRDPSLKVALTNYSWDFAAYAQTGVIYTEVSVREVNWKFSITMFYDYGCPNTDISNSLVTSALQTINFSNSPEVYRSPINSATLKENTQFEFGYSVAKHLEKEKNSNFNQTEIDLIAAAIKDNAKTRLKRRINVVYRGVINAVPTNDVQHIHYRLSKYGMRTHIKSRDWCLSPLFGRKFELCEDSLFKAVLIDDWYSVTSGEAIIYALGSNQLIDPKATVGAAIPALEGFYRTGTEVLVYKSCFGGCASYHVIQGPCHLKNAPPTQGTVGKCCKTFIDGSKTCYSVDSVQCSLLGGSWSAGSCTGVPATDCP